MSRRTNFLVFDEYVPIGTQYPTMAFTSTDLHQRLAQYDQLAIQVVIDNVTHTGPTAGFALNIQHSADGRNFLNLNPATNLPEVTVNNLTSNTVSVGYGSYPGPVSSGGALLGHVRFAIQFTEKTTAAHVKVYVTQRDQSK